MAVSLELSPWREQPLRLGGETIFAIGDVHGCERHLAAQHPLDKRAVFGASLATQARWRRDAVAAGTFSRARLRQAEDALI